MVAWHNCNQLSGRKESGSVKTATCSPQKPWKITELSIDLIMNIPFDLLFALIIFIVLHCGQLRFSSRETPYGFNLHRVKAMEWFNAVLSFFNFSYLVVRIYFSRKLKKLPQSLTTSTLFLIASDFILKAEKSDKRSEGDPCLDLYITSSGQILF